MSDTAGKGAKVAGGILFAIGALIIIVGGTITALGVSDQAENEDSGPLNVGEDQDRSDQNMQAIEVGILALAFGGLLAIGGSIALAAGMSQRSSQVKNEWRTVREQLVLLEPDLEIEALPEERTVAVSRPVMIGAGAVVAIMLLAVTGWAVGITPAALITGGEGPDDAPGTNLGQQSFERTMPAFATVAGTSLGPESTTHEFKVPAATGAIRVTLAWTPANDGVETIQFDLEVLVGNAWENIGSPVLEPGQQHNFIKNTAGTQMRFRAFPGEDGVVQSQDYTAHFSYFA